MKDYAGEATDPGRYLTENQAKQFFEKTAVCREVCHKCVFWHEYDEPTWDKEGSFIEYEGDCHRFPPTINTEIATERSSDLAEGVFPGVDSHQWCGEFKQKTAVPPKAQEV